MEILHPDTQKPLQPAKIVCIGKNYAKHAAEMDSDVPEEPMIFLKPSSSLVDEKGSIVIPAMSADVHHEVELVVLVGKKGRHIPEQEAMSYIAGYAVGLDMTARDLQAKAKKAGAPWSVAKGFDTFAAVGSFVGVDAVEDVHNVDIRLTINGTTRQDGNTRDMVFKLPTLIAYASRIFTLEPGDLLFTGTPEGVGPVLEGDTLTASIAGLPTLTIGVKKES
ncbi:MAG: fumarylacetoacetate hydrolase family protein [Bacteroidetes bacterium]|nr:fumarylacetoacetate hydrolase family protein [Bacteroidota bacterium]